MAETLVELVAKIKADSTQLEKGLTDAEKQTEASSKKMASSLKTVGATIVASGAAITAALGFMGKAAIDEEINIKRLATTVENSGTSYDKVKDSMEALIATTQRKTGVADDEQRDILNRLILVTNDYNTSLSLLPTVLNLAAAGEMDATTAATYLGKAYLELEENGKKRLDIQSQLTAGTIDLETAEKELAKITDTVSVRFGQASLQFESMEAIQNRVAGAAENLANPLSVLKASIGDVAETIGANLIPLIKDATNKIVDIAIKVQDWTKEHPELAKTLTLVALGVGAVLTVVGGLILILPTLISGVAAFGVVFHAALGPIGLISIAITALIAAGTALYLNWDKVTMFFKEAWVKIKLFFLEGVKGILDSLSNFTKFIPGLNNLVDSAREKIANIIESTKIEEEALRAEKALRDVSEVLVETTEIVEQNTDATKEQTKAALENIKALEEQKAALEETTDRLKRMRSEYEYTRSDAGRLGISIKDVTFTLFNMGKTTDEIASIIASLGDDAENVNKVMEVFGLTTKQVKEYLDSQRMAVNELAKSYDSMAESAKKAYAGPAFSKQIEYENGTPVLTWEQTLAYQHGELNIPEFATGGVVSGPTGMPQLATVHGGETIIPANESYGNVSINFTQPVFFDREDTMIKFVDMVSKGIDRKYRLGGRL